jgi:DNA polymerase I-like protein with 3'-5' exonuclease and polymerase domains
MVYLMGSQEKTQAWCQSKGYVRSIMGRYRRLEDAKDRSNGAAMGHALRAAINTPIQGMYIHIHTYTHAHTHTHIHTYTHTHTHTHTYTHFAPLYPGSHYPR